jgi:hypothetical protein
MESSEFWKILEDLERSGGVLPILGASWVLVGWLSVLAAKCVIW